MVYQMFLQELFSRDDVRNGIPNPLRIYDDNWPKFTSIHAAGSVDSCLR